MEDRARLDYRCNPLARQGSSGPQYGIMAVAFPAPGLK
jgi:hypothetical protein